MSIFDDIGAGLKKVLQAGMEAQGKLTHAFGQLTHLEKFTADDLQQLPDGVTPSESWEKLSAALDEMQRHAQALLDDWENQKHVAELMRSKAQQA